MKKIKKNLTKRGLALFLVLAMCLGQVNMAAFAAEDMTSTVDTAQYDTEAEESEESTETEGTVETDKPETPAETEESEESTEAEGTVETDGPEAPAEAEESTAALESTEAEETTAPEEPTVAEETTEAEESSAAEETTEAEEPTVAEETTEAEESSVAEETTEAEEPTVAEETTETEGSAEAEESTAATETTAAMETEPAKETAADKVPENVKAFLNIVAELPEIVTEENADEVLALVEVIWDTYDALDPADWEREDVTAAINKMLALMDNFGTLATYPIQYSENGIIYNLNEDGTATVKSGSPTDGKINIPAVVRYEGTEYKVTTIGKQAFYKSTDGYYAEVILPECLEIIDHYAFFKVYLTNQELCIPDTVTTIGQQAFYCFNDGTTDGAHVTKIILGSNVETIDQWAFYTTNTTHKVEVTCGTSITSCASNAFYSGSVSSVLVDGPKDSMISVLGSVTAFKGLIKYSQDNTIDHTQNGIIYNLNEDGTATVKSGSSIDGKIKIPASVTYNDMEYRVTAIGDQAFYNTGYAEVSLPEGLEIIGEYAFRNVYLINAELRIPDSVTTIKQQAFCYFNDGADGAHVTKIVLGSNVETIDGWAFYTKNTTNKVEVECGTKITSCASNAFYSGSVSSVLVNGPKYSMISVFSSISAFKGLVKYTEDGVIDTNNINCLEALCEAIEKAEDHTELILTKTFYGSSSSSIVIPAGKDITIKDDGNGQTIYGEYSPVFVVDAGGKLTFEGTSASSLKIYGENAAQMRNGTASIVQVKGELILHNAEIFGCYISGGMTHGLVVVNDGGKFTMDSGLIHNMNAYNAGLTAAVVVTPGGEFDMSGGSIEKNYMDSATTLAAGGVLLYTWNKNETPAKMTLSGNARIASNTNSGGSGGAGGGGITLVGDAELTMNGGIITDNTASGDQNHTGGGICVAGRSGAMSTDYDAKCVFTMNGGQITNNVTSSGSGGGIYINSNHVTLNAGRISGNTALNRAGGGVYVETPEAGDQTGARVNNAVIYGNTATNMGGGMYFCPTGSVNLSAYQGVGVFDNKATGTKAAGDDFVFVMTHPFANLDTSATLVDRMLGGGKVDWYKDGKLLPPVLGDNWGGVSSDSVRHNAEEPILIVPGKYDTSLALKAIVTEGAKELAMKHAELHITGNKAMLGGGIGSNGGILAGWVDPKEWNIEVNARKIWKDIPQDQWQPVTFQLKIDGKVVETVTLSEENDWKCEFTGLPTSAFRTIEIEEVTQGYAVSILKKTESGVVTGIEGVEVQQGEEKLEFTKEDIKDKEDETSFEFYGKDGNLIIALNENSDPEKTYTFIIDGPKENAGKTFKLRYNNAADELPQVVTPELNNSAAGELPQIITYALNKNAVEELSQTVTFKLNKEGTGSEATITIKGGSSVTIVGVPQGQYTATKGNVSFEVTNSPAGNLVISKKIVMEGPENPDVLGREFSFIVEGPANGGYDNVKVVDETTGEETNLIFASKEDNSAVFTATVIITGANSVTIRNLPVGKYTVKEENSSIDGYKWSYTVSGDGLVEEDGTAEFAVTNTYIPITTSLTVNKVWVNDGGINRPSNVTVQLYKNNTAEGNPVTLSTDKNWSYTWNNLANIDSDGNKITWTVQEIAIANGYTATINYNEGGTKATITNTYIPDGQPATTSLTVNKVWANIEGINRPSDVTVQLYRNESAEGGPVTLSADNNWRYTWSGLDKTDEDGSNIAWTVAEIDIPDGYTATYAENGTAVTITNTYTPSNQPATTSLTVNKVWANDEGISRPANVTVQLHRNGAADGSFVTLSADNNWRYTWSDLDKTDAEGKEITWTVGEIDVPQGYTASYTTDGTVVTVTNTYDRPRVPGRPSRNPGNPPPTPPEPGVEIPENPTPLASREPEVEILEEDVPLAGLPKTGDISMMWYVMTMMSTFGLMILKLKKRKEEI